MCYIYLHSLQQQVEGKSNLNVTVPHLSDIRRANIDIWHDAKISEQRLTSLNSSIQNMKLLPPLVKVPLAHVLSRLNIKFHLIQNNSVLTGPTVHHSKLQGLVYSAFQVL